MAIYASLVLVRLWYQLWSVHTATVVTGLPFVVVQTVQTPVLMLVASAALPDEDDFRDGRVDLRAYCDAHARHIWTAYLIFLVNWSATGNYFQWRFGQLAFLLTRLFFIYFTILLILTVAAVFVGRRAQSMMLVLLPVHEVVVPSNLFGLVFG